MDSRDFVQRLLEDIGAAERAREGVRPKGDDTAELPEFIVKHWLSFAVYYERAAAVFIGGWLRTTAESDALVQFAHQIEDEANHYRWLSKHLVELGGKPDAFVPPPEWRSLMDEYYPSLEHLVERLAAHNVASESGVLGFLEYNMKRFPEGIRATVERVYPDEKFHVAFGCSLLEKYCTTDALQDRARRAAFEAIDRMRAAREVFVQL